MKKLIPVILCCAMLLAACGSSADSAPAASESTSAAASSEAASSAESIIGGADGETDIAVSDEANTANLDAAVAAIEAVNPIANPRALDDFSVENELMLTMDNLVGSRVMSRTTRRTAVSSLLPRPRTARSMPSRQSWKPTRRACPPMTCTPSLPTRSHWPRMPAL